MSIHLTETAVEQVNLLLKAVKERGEIPEDVSPFLRLGVKGGGCSGLQYSLEFDTEKGPRDRIFPDEKMKAKDISWGFEVVIDPKSYLYLVGCTLDYVAQGLVGGFTFINPQAKSSCGCGQSFQA